jgi:hypothetical protein
VTLEARLADVVVGADDAADVNVEASGLVTAGATAASTGAAVSAGAAAGSTGVIGAAAVDAGAEVVAGADDTGAAIGWGATAVPTAAEGADDTDDERVGGASLAVGKPPMDPK